MEDPGGCIRGLGGVVHAFEEHRELVAAEAGDGVRRAHGDLQAAGHLLEDVVAGGVAEAVVDRLEVVEVDEDDRDVREPALRAHERVLDAVENSARFARFVTGSWKAWWASCSSNALPLADVAAVEHDAADVLVLEQVGVLHLEPERRAVAMDERALEGVRVGAAAAVAGDELVEARPVGFAQEPAELGPLHLVCPITEYALDRGALVGDDAVGVENA